MNAVMTPPRPRSPQLTAVAIVLIGFAVTVGVAFAVARLGVGAPTSFRQLTVNNPTPYQVNVDVTGAKRDGWLEVGSPERVSADGGGAGGPGPPLVFRFSYGGVEAGELVVSRDRLAHDGWTITVPAEVTERLRNAGLKESAP